jgi:hypothetical protein
LDATETRDLPVKLTEEELAQIAKALAVQAVARAGVQAEKDAADDVWRHVLKGHDAEIERLTKLYGDGTEERPVECRREFDMPANVYRLVRTDTGEAVIERAMTAEELERVRQGDLFPHPEATPLPPAATAYAMKEQASSVLVEVAKRVEGGGPANGNGAKGAPKKAVH